MPRVGLFLNIILAVDTNQADTQILKDLTGVSYLEVTPDELASIDLLAFDLLYVP